jgi:hypothetical protein
VATCRFLFSRKEAVPMIEASTDELVDLQIPGSHLKIFGIHLQITVSELHMNRTFELRGNQLKLKTVDKLPTNLLSLCFLLCWVARGYRCSPRSPRSSCSCSLLLLFFSCAESLQALVLLPGHRCSAWLSECTHELRSSCS